MSETGTGDKRGTIKDWPIEVALLCAVLFLFAGDVTLRALFAVAAVGGLVLWLARRGSFTPRDR